jgi:hypothetical protein
MIWKLVKDKETSLTKKKQEKQSKKAEKMMIAALM